MAYYYKSWINDKFRELHRRNVEALESTDLRTQRKTNPISPEHSTLRRDLAFSNLNTTRILVERQYQIAEKKRIQCYILCTQGLRRIPYIGCGTRSQTLASISFRVNIILFDDRF